MNSDFHDSPSCYSTADRAAPVLAADRHWNEASQRLAALLFRCGKLFSAWQERGRHRRILDRFNDHRLKDIGLHRIGAGFDR